MGKYAHLTLDDRQVIAQMLRDGYSAGKIAKHLQRSRSGIYREINEHSVNGRYDPVFANSQHLDAQKRTGAKSIFVTDTLLMNQVRKLLLDGNSPEKICTILKAPPYAKKVSVNTIYRSIKAGEFPQITMETIRPKTVTMFSNGCLTVPQHIRAKYNFRDGDQFSVAISDDGNVIFHKMETP